MQSSSLWAPKVVTGTFSPSDPVGRLPNCGKKRSDELAALGIFTIQNLLDYDSDLDFSGLVRRFQSVARQRLRPEETSTTPFFLKESPTPPPLPPRHKTGHPIYPSVITLEDHSWFGRIGHIEFESTGPVVRVRIGPLLVTPYGAVLRVQGKVRTRAVSPLLLAAMHTLWVRTEILSEDEVEPQESEEDGEEPEEEQPLKEEENTDLPFFTLNLGDLLDTLTPEQRDMIRLSVREVQSFQRRSILTMMLGHQ